jgi:hypothetical protein
MKPGYAASAWGSALAFAHSLMSPCVPVSRSEGPAVASKQIDSLSTISDSPAIVV